MDRPNHFRIIDNDTYYTVENVKANDFDNFHTHLNKRSNRNKRNVKSKDKYKVGRMLIGLICNKKVPDSDYLRESAKRLSRDERYIRDIEYKESKDKDKQKFVRINRGGVRIQR